MQRLRFQIEALEYRDFLIFFLQPLVFEEWNEPTESLGKRIRGAELMKIPYILVVGEKEESDGAIAVRGRKGDEGVMKVEKFLEHLSREIQERK